MPAQLWRLGFAALWHPELMAAGALVAGAYLWTVIRARGETPTQALRVVSFLLGVLLLYAGVGTPLDAISDHFLFSAHMLEHVVLSLFAPPLLLAGMPPWLLRRLLGPRLQKLAGWLTQPLVGLIVFNLAFSVYHFPLIYEAGLHSEAVHFFQHAVLVATALMLWWPVITPLPEMARLSPPGKLLYLFLASIAMTPIFALLVFAPTPLYPTYLHTTQVFGFTPLQDQQLGAVVMKLGALAAYGIAAGIVFFSWVAREAARERAATLSVYRPGQTNPALVHRTHPAAPDQGPRRSAH